MNNNEKVDILIIDSYNMIIRSKNNWTKSYDRKLVVLSFLRQLKKTIDHFQPSKVIMALDDYIGNSFRRKLLPDYKLKRKRKNEQDAFSEEFKRQKEIILKVIDKILPVYTLKYKGYEADDIIAMLCKILSKDQNIVVWSNDRDLVQIQQKMENVKIWNPQYKKFCTLPNYNLVNFKSLAGDRSDNILGVKGIGVKTARKVLNSQYEFIKLIASNPERYAQFKTNKKVIDLLDNELAIPGNLHYIIKRKIKYNMKEFHNLCKFYKFDEILYKKENFDRTFCSLQQRNNSLEISSLFEKGDLNYE